MAISEDKYMKGIEEELRLTSARVRYESCYSITLIKANRYYASTKKCSCCGNRKVMEIDERTYKCEECNLVIDRDLNAAINLAQYK